MNYLMKVKWHGDPTVRELFTNLKATRPDWITNSLVAAKGLDGKRASNTLAVKPSKAVLSPENPLRFTETDHLCLVSHGNIAGYLVGDGIEISAQALVDLVGKTSLDNPAVIDVVACNSYWFARELATLLADVKVIGYLSQVTVRDGKVRCHRNDTLLPEGRGKIIFKREGKTLKVGGLGGLSDEMSHSLHAHDRAGAGSTDWFVTKV